MRLENVRRSEGFAAGSLGPVAITVWDAAATANHAREASNVLAALARVEKSLVVLAILGPAVPPPDAEIRDIMSQHIAKFEDRIGSVIQVIEGQGFRAATMRAVLTGMTLMLRFTKRIDKVAGSVEEAAGTIAGQLNGRVLASDIVRAVADLRRGSTV